MAQAGRNTGARRSPGQVRDAIVGFLRARQSGASVADIRSAVEERLGDRVAASSVRSYLALNDHVDGAFERLTRGRYRLRAR